MAKKRALIMHPADNVATAVESVQSGDEVQVPLADAVRTLTAAEDVAFGFKIALEDIPEGALIRKYGEAIGRAGKPIPKGALVHIHNLEGIRARGDLERSGQ